MKSKQLINLTVILVVLIGLVIYKQSQKPAELAVQEYAPLELKFEQETVASVTLMKPIKDEQEEYVELVKQEVRWVMASLNGARVDEKKVDEFLAEIHKAKGELRAQDKSLLPDFGIGDDEGYHVILRDQEKKDILNFYIGTEKANQYSIFVRQSGEGRVFLTSANLFGKLGIYGKPEEESLDNNYWAELNLLDVTADQVMGIQTTRFTEGAPLVTSHLTAVKDSEDGDKKKWSYVKDDIPFAIDAEKIKRFVESFQTWRGQRVLDPDQEDANYGFENPQWQLIFTLQGGVEVKIVAGRTDESSRSTYMDVSSEPVVFQMSPYYFENMDIDDSKFFIDNPLRIDAAKIAKMVVQKEKERYEVYPMERTWDDLTAYIEDIKTSRFSRLLFDAEEVKKVDSPSKTFVEIFKEGEEIPIVLDIGGVVLEAPKEFAAIIRNTAQPLAFSSSYHRRLFEQMSRLEAPPEETKEEEEVPSDEGIEEAEASE